MAKETTIRERMESGEVLLGTFVGLRDPAITEMIAQAGYEFVVFDMEHNPLSISDVEQLTRAADIFGMFLMVRIPRGDTATALRLVDSGIKGIFAPHVTSADDVRALIDSVKYHPVGHRGIDFTTRAGGYGIGDMNRRSRIPSSSPTDFSTVTPTFDKLLRALRSADDGRSPRRRRGGSVRTDSAFARSLDLWQCETQDRPELVGETIIWLSCRFRGSSGRRSAWQRGAVAAAVEEGESDEVFGFFEAVGHAGENPQLGVGAYLELDARLALDMGCCVGDM